MADLYEVSEENDKFSKRQLLKSNYYKDKKDLINALLNDNEYYSKDEVDKIIDEYLKGSVI